jgi:hypothetical protein
MTVKDMQSELRATQNDLRELLDYCDYHGGHAEHAREAQTYRERIADIQREIDRCVNRPTYGRFA